MYNFKAITTFFLFLLSLLNAQTLEDSIPLAFPTLNTIIDPKSLASIKLIKEPIVVKIKAGQYSGLILSPTLYNQSKNEQQPLLPLVGFNPNYKVQGLPVWGSFSVANNTLSLNPPSSFNEPIHTQIFFQDPKNNSANLSVTFQPYFNNLGAQKFSLIANSSFDRKPGVWTLAYPIYETNQENLNNVHHVLDSAFMIDQAINPWTTLTNLITPQHFLFIQNSAKADIDIPDVSHVTDQQTNTFNPFDNTNNLTIVNTTTVTVTNTSYPFSNETIIPQTNNNNLNNLNTPQNNFIPFIDNTSYQQNHISSFPFGSQTIETTSTTAYFPTNNYPGNMNGGFPIINNNNFSPTNSLPSNTTEVTNIQPIVDSSFTNITKQLIPQKNLNDQQFNYPPLIFNHNSNIPATDTTIINDIPVFPQPKQTSTIQTINSQPVIIIPPEKPNIQISLIDLSTNISQNIQPIQVLSVPSTIDVPTNQQNTLIIPQNITPIPSTNSTNPIIQITPIPSIQNAPQFINISDVVVNSPIPQISQIVDQNQAYLTQPTQLISIQDQKNTTNKQESNQNTQLKNISQIISSTQQLTPAIVKEQQITSQQPITLPQPILPVKIQQSNQTSLVPLPLPQISNISQFDISSLIGIDFSKLNTTPPIVSNPKPVQLTLPNIPTPTHIGFDTNQDIATPITMNPPPPSYVDTPKISYIETQDISNLLNQTANNVLKPVESTIIDLTNSSNVSVAKQAVNNTIQKIADIVETTPTNQ